MEDLELARQLADIADEISMSHFDKNPDFKVKADGTIVTIADWEIEAALRRRLEQESAGDAILGEEEGLAGDHAGRIWILDPIDGTANFAAGIPVFATLIGLRAGGKTRAGVVSAPALGERYEAAEGDGARMNGEPISVSKVAHLGDATVCFGSHRRLLRRGYGPAVAKILEGSKRDRGFGDFWGHMLVARGAAEAMAEPSLQAWDVMPLEIIVTEAGGRLTTFKGDPWPEQKLAGEAVDSSCLTTNGLLHEPLVQLLAT